MTLGLCGGAGTPHLVLRYIRRFTGYTVKLLINARRRLLETWHLLETWSLLEHWPRGPCVY